MSFWLTPTDIRNTGAFCLKYVYTDSTKRASIADNSLGGVRGNIIFLACSEICFIKVLDAILTSRQSDQKLQCLYGNQMANINFKKIEFYTICEWQRYNTT